jgi:hypothetical protein
MDIRRSLQEFNKLLVRFEQSGRLPFGSDGHGPAVSKPEDIPRLSHHRGYPIRRCWARRSMDARSTIARACVAMPTGPEGSVASTSNQ